jgi:hypothetical protein
VKSAKDRTDTAASDVLSSAYFLNLAISIVAKLIFSKKTLSYQSGCLKIELQITV